MLEDSDNDDDSDAGGDDEDRGGGAPGAAPKQQPDGSRLPAGSKPALPIDGKPPMPLQLEAPPKAAAADGKSDEHADGDGKVRPDAGRWRAAMPAMPVKDRYGSDRGCHAPGGRDALRQHD